jgi:hypothetical protein
MALADFNTRTVINEAITANDVIDASNFAKVFSGTGEATAVQMEKIGDIYVKTDTGNVYIAKGTTKATDWVAVGPEVGE